MAFMDMLIIKIGLVELVYCPEIPIRVTLNEYIEMAKEFSTERSNLFVNGLLDRFLIDLRAAGKIRKLETEELEEEI
jgi:N utilization substance protein B